MNAGCRRFPLLLSGLLLCGYAHHVPAPVWNAATLEWAAHYHLSFPVWHLVFTPFCSVADFLTTLSAQQAKCLVAWFIVGAFFFFGWKRGALAILGFIAFVAWGALVPRPMGRLIANDPDILLIDFHSHTNYS